MRRQPLSKILMERSHQLTNKGVTLIEVIVVIALLAIVSTFAYPNIKNWLPNYRLKAAARDLYSNMQLARMNAVKQNKKWAIVFDVNNNRYCLCSSAGADGKWSTLGDDRIEKTITLTSYKGGVTYGHGNATKNATKTGGSFPPDNVTFRNGTSDPNVAVFTPKGLCIGSGYCYLQNMEQTTYAIGALSSGVLLLKKWKGNGWD